MRTYWSSTSTNVAQAPLLQRTVTLDIWSGPVDMLPLRSKHYPIPVPSLHLSIILLFADF